MRLSDEFRKSLGMMAAAYGLRLIAGDSSEALAARNYLNGRGISTEDASLHGLGIVTEEFDVHKDYQGRICFPYVTARAGVVSLKFRVAHDCTEQCQHSKYITPYPTRIYNPGAFDKADRLGWIAIAEGEIDTITLMAKCDIPAVGVPGTDTWAKHPEWKELFRGYRKVFVFEDQDKPNQKGEKPGEKLSKQILKDIDTAVLVKLPGKDVNETFLKFGAAVIKEKIIV